MGKKKILLVEDEALTAMDLKSNLILLGYEVPAVMASGEDAIRIAAELRPDLVLMDITLAGPMNGIQAADKIWKAHAIPVVFLSAHTDAETIGRAKASEPFGYLPKPCSMDTLMSTIAVALYKSEADALRRKNEQALKENEERYHTVADYTYDWEYWINEQNLIVYMSPSCERITGYAAAEFIADRNLLSRIVHPDDTALYENHKHDSFDVARENIPREAEFRIIEQNGNIRWIHHVCQPVWGTAGVFRGIRANNRDISLRKEIENNLKRVMNEQKIIIDNIGVGIMFLKNRKIIWANKSLTTMFGYTFEEVEGIETELFYPDRESYLKFGSEAYTALARGEVYSAEVQWKKKDGATIWCNLIGQAVNPDHLDDGAIWLFENISGRKKMDEELIKTRNLESLGILAGGIAHDFNNLLQGLLGNIAMAKMYTPDTSKAFAFLDNAEGVYSAASSLTSQLIAFSSGGTYIKETLQPKELIKDSVLQNLSGSNIQIEFDLPDNLQNIQVDTGQLRQAIGNITLNARESMPSGGVLLVRTENIKLEKRDHIGLAPGEYIKISIQDQGCGITPDILPKIFDPYFSTKERGPRKGMGLGLTISNAIIKKHNGVITVDSEKGKGSTFALYIPAIVSEVMDADLKTAKYNAAFGKGLRVLMMDDEPAVFRVAIEYMELLGYRVDVALNGDEAINTYKTALQTGDPYAAAILDLTIPGGMGGQDALQQIRKIDPQVKAIVSSGYANDPAVTDCIKYGFLDSLVKPYRLNALKETLEKILR